MQDPVRGSISSPEGQVGRRGKSDGKGGCGMYSRAALQGNVSAVWSFTCHSSAESPCVLPDLQGKQWPPAHTSPWATGTSLGQKAGVGASAGSFWYQSIPSRCRAFDLWIIFCSLCRTYELIPRNGAGRSETWRTLQFWSFPNSWKKVRVSGLNNKSHSYKTVQWPFPCHDGSIPPQPGGTTHSLAGLSD